MRSGNRFLGVVLLAWAGLVFDVAAGEAGASCPASLDFEMRPLAASEPVRLCDRHAGQVLLVVNTASQCGFTPQYEGLEALNAEFQDRGFHVLGFPSGDFAGQEYEDETDIAEFCRSNYGIQFPMYEKVHASRRHAASGTLYHHLGTATGEFPSWNFHKYLIGRDGEVRGSFGTRVPPDDRRLRAAIEAAL
nr:MULTISPECIES: vitamin B12 ABC transporter permease [unclassified Thioalkalivibrio]